MTIKITQGADQKAMKVLDSGAAQETEQGNEYDPQMLRDFIERIERLEEDKAAIASDIRDVYQQAKSSGFEPKVMREVVKLRKMDQHDIEEEEALLDLYKQALGMQ